MKQTTKVSFAVGHQDQSGYWWSTNEFDSEEAAIRQADEYRRMGSPCRVTRIEQVVTKVIVYGEGAEQGS
jgi:hypothetical protein